MKKKILIFMFLLALIGFQQVEGIEWVWTDDQTELTGNLFQTRAFFSNYTKRFYAFFNEHQADVLQGVYYSTSFDAINWIGRTRLEMWNESVFPAYWGRYIGKLVDFYLEPNGKYLHHVFGQSVGGKKYLTYQRYELFQNGTMRSENYYQFTYAPFLLDHIEEVSICADSEGYPYISVVEHEGGVGYYAQLLRCNQNDGTWFTWTKYTEDGVGIPANADYYKKVKVIPLENQGIHWFIAYESSAGHEQLRSFVNYWDGTGWHSSGAVDDAEGGDWANGRWCLGWYGNLTVLFSQDELGATDIRLTAQFRDGINAWENRTIVSFEVPGDAGSVKFLPLVAVDEDLSISYIWGIVGNETLWYRQSELNSTGDHDFLSDWVYWQDCGFNLVDYEFSSFGSLYSPMVVELLEDASPDWIWYDYLGGEGEFAFAHLNTTLYNQDGTVNDEWIFEGEVYDLVSFVQNAERFFVNTTDSRHQIRFHWNNETEQMWISVDPSDQFTIGLPWSNFTRYPNNITRLQWRFIPDRSIIDCEDEAWGYYIENDFYGNSTGTLGFETNIYNLGGFTYYDFQGDGGRTIGGHPWELYATDGTAGSSARAEQIFRKLQHLHFLIEIDMDNEWDSQGGEFDFTPGVGYVDIGIDYLINGTWVEGFFVRLYVESADVGNHGGGNDMNWIEWSVDWYNYNPGTGNNDMFRTGYIYSNYWGYENENLDPDYHNRTSAQLWVDLWFDRTNASTTVSGQINSMYYGMKEHGSAWWFGYGVFQPMKGEYENAMALDDLYDEGGNVTDSLKFDLMRVFVEVEKVAIEEGDDETWMIRAVENVNHKLADDRMQGVEQPSFEETLVLEMPMFQSMNPLVRAIDGIASAVWKGALGFQKILWSAMDSFFAWAGFGTGFFSRITAFLGAIPELFMKMMENIPIMITNMVELVDDIFGMVVRILPEFVLGIGYLTDSVINYWTTLTSFFTGGILTINIIEDLQLGDWIRAGFSLLPAWEMFSIIWAEDSGKKAKERIDFYSMLFNGVINFVKGAISFMQSFIQTIMDILPG